MTQNQALDIMRLGRNVFLTGAAGSGKSYLVKKYIGYLKKNKVRVGVTASTGIAATQRDTPNILLNWSFVGGGGYADARERSPAASCSWAAR
jgi:ATP-dependent DNA helicase PIF1